MANNFSYPVLSAGNDDYVESSIDCTVSCIMIGERLEISADFKLDNPEIVDLIAEGYAEYCVLISCSKSSYRSSNTSSSPNMGIQISGSLLSDKIEVIPAVIATQNIDRYENELLNVEYKGCNIIIPRGGFVAIAPSTSIKINRELFRSLESICKFAASDEKYSKNYIEEESGYITIFLTQNLFEKYLNLPKNLEEVFTAMYITPVLIDLVQDYWIDEPRKSDSRWYKVLDERFALVFGEGYEIENSYNAIMRVLGELLSDASNTVFAEFGNKIEGGSDDEYS